MGVLCDTQIRDLIAIEPFEENVKRPGRVSYGVSSYGYDVRVGPLFKVFTNVSATGRATVVDPKCFTDDLFVTIDTRQTGSDQVVSRNSETRAAAKNRAMIRTRPRRPAWPRSARRHHQP